MHIKNYFLGNCQGDWKLLWEKPVAERDQVGIKKDMLKKLGRGLC